MIKKNDALCTKIVIMFDSSFFGIDNEEPFDEFAIKFDEKKKLILTSPENIKDISENDIVAIITKYDDKEKMEFEL